MLSDRYEGVAFWTSTEATDAINEALLMWNLLTGQWATPISITTVADQLEYDLTSSIVFGTKVGLDDRPLNKSYLWEMNSGRPGWQAQTTASDDVPDTVQSWIPLGLKKIALWPADSVGGATLTIDGVATTPRLTSGGDFIDLGSELLNAILGYAIHVLSFKEGGARFQSTMPLYQSFLEQAMKRNELLTELYRQYIHKDFEAEQEHPRA
jgi:hypothetical protein